MNESAITPEWYGRHTHSSNEYQFDALASIWIGCSLETLRQMNS